MLLSAMHLKIKAFYGTFLCIFKIYMLLAFIWYVTYYVLTKKFFQDI